jgi:hypothetical protein
MGISKLIKKTDENNRSGLDLSYHIIGVYAIDKRINTCVAGMLSFVNRDQRLTSAAGGFVVSRQYRFSQADSKKIIAAKDKEAAIYGVIKNSIKSNVNSPEENIFLGATDVLEKGQ